MWKSQVAPHQLSSPVSHQGDMAEVINGFALTMMWWDAFLSVARARARGESERRLCCLFFKVLCSRITHYHVHITIIKAISFNNMTHAAASATLIGRRLIITKGGESALIWIRPYQWTIKEENARECAAHRMCIMQMTAWTSFSHTNNKIQISETRLQLF